MTKRAAIHHPMIAEAPAIHAQNQPRPDSRRRINGIFISDFEQGEIGPDLFRHACTMGAGRFGVEAPGSRLPRRTIAQQGQKPKVLSKTRAVTVHPPRTPLPRMADAGPIGRRDVQEGETTDHHSCACSSVSL